MAKKSGLVTDSLVEYDSELPVNITSDKANIENALKVPVNVWNWMTEGKVALSIPFSIKTQILPFSEILEHEPLLLVYSLDDPTKAPKAYPNRLSFPFEKHAHINPTYENENVRSLCLTLGDYNDWYATRLIEDVIDLILDWFSKAAQCKLSEDSEEFEPLVIIEECGLVAYNSARLLSVIESEAAKSSRYIPIKCIKSESNSKKSDTLYKFDKDWNLNEKATELSKNHRFGIIILPDPKSDGTISAFRNSFPSTKKELNTYVRKHKVHLEELFSNYKPNYIDSGVDKDILLDDFLVLLAIRRPKRIRGSESNFEILHFQLRNKGVHPSDAPNSSSVCVLKHFELLSTESAKRISNNHEDIPIIDIIGAGSLGSKIGKLFASKGHTSLSIYDPNNLKPHNFCRHPLGAENLFKNKAEALVASIRKMYLDSELKDLHGHPNAFNLDDYIQRLQDDEQRILLDTTASHQLSLETFDKQLPQHVRLSQAFISQQGKLGFLLREGLDKNPRIDDIQMFIKASAKSNPVLEEWLHDPKATSITTLGFGCASETVLASDDDISTHASLFTSYLSLETNNSTNDGYFFFNHIGDMESFSKKIIVPTFESVESPQGLWEVRIPQFLVKKFQQLHLQNLPNETGGLLVGSFNRKTNVVHIMDISDAPADSKKSSFRFNRGTVGNDEWIQSWTRPTNGSLGYIGEWHTHPGNQPKLSSVDIANMIKFKSINDKHRLPTLSIIVTNNGKEIIPHIFDIHEHPRTT